MWRRLPSATSSASLGCSASWFPPSTVKLVPHWVTGVISATRRPITTSSYPALPGGGSTDITLRGPGMQRGSDHARRDSPGLGGIQAQGRITASRCDYQHLAGVSPGLTRGFSKPPPIRPQGLEASVVRLLCDLPVHTQTRTA